MSKHTSNSKETKNKKDRDSVSIRYNLVMIGQPGTGKSCITIRFIAGRFLEYYEPTIEDSYRKVVDLDDDPLPSMLEIFDTAGADEFTLVRDAYIREAHGFLCIYAIDNKESFDEVPKLYDHVKRCKASQQNGDETEIPFVLVGNKCDKSNEERQVTYEEGMEMKNKLNLSLFLETSALTGQNINEAFYDLVRVIKKVKNQVPEGEPNTPEQKKVMKKKSCIIL